MPDVADSALHTPWGSPEEATDQIVTCRRALGQCLPPLTASRPVPFSNPTYEALLTAIAGFRLHEQGGPVALGEL